MIAVAIDVDDTLVDTRRRTQAIWHHVIGREVPLHEVDALSGAEIFERHASQGQRLRSRELQGLFMDIQLCRNEVGVELIGLDEPVPLAAEILQDWGKLCTLVYLTGRMENLRQLTLRELKKFGFPTSGTRLLMFDPRDWEGSSAGRTLADARSRLFSQIVDEHRVVRVVDDFPGYFETYREFKVPDRIGLLRSKRYGKQDFIERGATRVVESWCELHEDPPILN